MPTNDPPSPPTAPTAELSSTLVAPSPVTVNVHPNPAAPLAALQAPPTSAQKFFTLLAQVDGDLLALLAIFALVFPAYGKELTIAIAVCGVIAVRLGRLGYNVVVPSSVLGTPVPTAAQVALKGLAVLAVVMLVASCGASTPTPSAPSAPPTASSQRAQFRAAILAADAAYKLTGAACVTAAKAANDDAIRARCASVLVPAGQGLVVAAAALDAWDDAASPAIVRCRLEGAVLSLVATSTELVTLPPNVTAAIQDAEVLGSGLVGACPDSGSGG